MIKKTPVLGFLIFSLLLAALITRNGDMAWMMLPFLAYLGVGTLRAQPRERVRLRAERTCEQSSSAGITTVAVKLTVQNLARETVCLSIQEPMQAGLRVTDGELSCQAALPPGESAELRYTCTAARGIYSWEGVRTLVSDPLGLWETEMLLPAGAAVQIQPQIKRFKNISFRPQSTLHSPGSIPARLGGSGTDFFGVREYQSGDSLRWLDWRLTARHPHRYFTKEFEQEEIAEIGLILDARQMTELRIGEGSLFEHSVGAAASLAEMFLHQGHRLSLLVFGESLSYVFPGYGKRQLCRIMSCLSKAKVGNENGIDFIPVRMFPSHALIILISSLPSSDRPFLQRLRAFGYQVLVISPDPIDYAFPTLAQDFTNRLAIRATRLERYLRLSDVARLQIQVIDWKVSQPLFPLIQNALSRSRGQRE
jgi:uncharacterized protein (DUF58 family)